MSILDLSSELEGKGHVKTLSLSQTPSQQMIDEVWETDWKACKLAFSFSPYLPLSAASSVFMSFLLKDQTHSWPAVLRFSETFGRKMNSCKEQLWDKLNHQERSIEWAASGFFFFIIIFSSSQHAYAMFLYV